MSYTYQWVLSFVGGCTCACYKLLYSFMYIDIHKNLSLISVTVGDIKDILHQWCHRYTIIVFINSSSLLFSFRLVPFGLAYGVWRYVPKCIALCTYAQCVQKIPINFQLTKHNSPGRRLSFCRCSLRLWFDSETNTDVNVYTNCQKVSSYWAF